MTRQIPTCLFLCFAGLAPLVARAADFESAPTADEGEIRIWRTADGLPSDSVMAVLQTRDGYLWIGTGGGLVRFDGVKFTAIDFPGATGDGGVAVTALCEDTGGSLWIGTRQNGLYQLNEGELRHHTKARGLLDDSVTSLAADHQGFVWIGTKAGLNLAAGRDFRSLTTRDGLPDDMISGVHVARSGTVWITTRGGMSRFVNGRLAPVELQTEGQGRSPEYLGAYEDQRGNLWAFGDTYLINLATEKRFNYFRGSEAASVRIWSLCEGRDGRLWIGTSGRGLYCFDDNRFQPVILGELRWPYDVRAICEDREGNLWLGTSGGGLLQLRPQPVHIVRVGEGLPASPPTALALDASGRAMVGLQRGGLFVSEAGRFDRFAGGAGMELPEFVTSLGIAPEGTVWAGTLSGGLYGLRNGQTLQFTTANGLGDDAVLAVCVDGEGNVWAGTRAGTLHRFGAQGATRFDSANGLSGAPITALLPTTTGVWLGMEDGAVLRCENGGFTIAQSADEAGRHPVLALQAGEADRIWIGTAGGGLVCLANGNRRQWTKEDGLPDDFVAGVVEDAAKNLWLATGTGIYRIARSVVNKAISARAPLECKLMSDTKTVFEAHPGFGGVRARLSPEGKLWFATTEGVLNVDTQRPEREAAPLPVYLESVAFNGLPPRPLRPERGAGTAAAPGAPAIFPGVLRSLDFHFTALNFTAPGKVRFRHMLEGLDLDWVGESSERFVRYGRLSYGDYRFRVAARNADGDWHELAVPFAFVIPTPLYFQPWAIALYIFAAIALVAAIVRVVSHRRLRLALARLEQQQSLERERMRIARDMHDEMGSKLTKISFLSEHVKMDAVPTGPLAGKLASIAETSRDLLKTMDEIVWVVNPRNDTLEHLAAYLSHHAAEYFQNTSIECEMKLPRAMPEHPLSSEARHNLFLAFEEALNNVLKHSGAARVKIEMMFKPPDFEIIISDNGRGFEVPPPVAAKPPAQGDRGGRGGNGLRNMHQRLADLGGECLVRSQPGQGSTVTLRLRLSPAAARQT